MEGQILNTVLQSFLDQVALAYGNLLPVAYYFFYAFATITLVKLGLSYAFEQNINILSVLLVKLFKMGLILWCINNLPYLHEVLRDGAIKLGIKAAGSTNSLDLILNPSEIAQYGSKVIYPIRKWIYNLSWLSPKNLGINLVNVLFGIIAIILILGAFFYLAFQMFMTLVDFYFTSMLVPIFLAFHSFTPTAWMAVGAIRSPIQHAVKLFTMAFIINVAEHWIGSFILREGVYCVTEISYLVLASFVLVALSLKAGTWASGMFTGTPTASGGDLMTTAAGVFGIGAGLGVLGRQVALGGQKTAGFMTKGAISTVSGAVTGAELRGASYSGNSQVGKLAAMTYGAVQGAAGVILSTPKAIQERIMSSFNESVNYGMRQGYTATGGNIADPLPQDQPTKTANRANHAKKYQRIAKAFEEKQDFDKH